MPFRIGHSAYTGTNRLAYAASKTAAVAILQGRGITRDTARKACTEADGGSFTTVSGTQGVVEIIKVDSAPFEGEAPARVNLMRIDKPAP